MKGQSRKKEVFTKVDDSQYYELWLNETKNKDA